jgi:His-Xaa-Ser system protein HxsD
MEPNISIAEIKDFGRCVKLQLKDTVYSLSTICAAGYIFLDRAYIMLDQDKDKTIVFLFPKQEGADLRTLGKDFLDELINYAHYSSQAAANAEVTKVILQKALFSASPPLAQEVEDRETEKLVEELGKERQ